MSLSRPSELSEEVLVGLATIFPNYIGWTAEEILAILRKNLPRSVDDLLVIAEDSMHDDLDIAHDHGLTRAQVRHLAMGRLHRIHGDTDK